MSIDNYINTAKQYATKAAQCAALMAAFASPLYVGGCGRESRFQESSLEVNLIRHQQKREKQIDETALFDDDCKKGLKEFYAKQGKGQKFPGRIQDELAAFDVSSISRRSRKNIEKYLPFVNFREPSYADKVIAYFGKDAEWDRIERIMENQPKCNPQEAERQKGIALFYLCPKLFYAFVRDEDAKEINNCALTKEEKAQFRPEAPWIDFENPSQGDRLFIAYRRELQKNRGNIPPKEILSRGFAFEKWDGRIF